ncbi:MAG: bifunctional demethylmenaquinone methyltransferase/2-methoxy-6-polyprenyl-1,4-benzoquinol methylase UbiE [Planctomycetota bacterium]|nr:MAG: bifunctional demethylmenaquinone methyltransferase/2-methoxy-6-polyprenyl-1,4-benzoquinol methylase UbiE [Planctomycetota bacterium]
MTGTPTEKLVWDDARLADPHRQEDKARRVRAMFDEIAPTYERVNRVMSAGRDAYWRRRAVDLARIAPDDRVIDLACGTGDFARAFWAARPARVVGCDFAERMLALAARRPSPAAPAKTISWCRADALNLPFADGSFTVASCAFGVRNWQDLARGLSEMHRVLRPGGRAVILEFSVPSTPVIGGLYLFYFRRVLPRLATWISGDRTGAYRYLPASVSSFIDESGMASALSSAGFGAVEHHRLTLGVVSVHIARKT